MDFETARADWIRDGFVILPGLLSADTLAPAMAELQTMFPSAAGFHDGTDERRGRYLGDEFEGIDEFPFKSVQLSLLAVCEPVIDLAKALLGSESLHMYSAEAWAKFTGAADYEQLLHRDYLNHTLVVPSDAPEFQQVEMFVYLVDVPEQLGPPHLVSRRYTGDLPAKPNWLPRSDIVDDDDFVAETGRPDLYEREISGAGPAGTVIAFQPGTFHRGTGLAAHRGARYSMQLCFRPASVEWAVRTPWGARSHSTAWYRFVERATPEQLALFGFPPPGHRYWTPATLAGVAERYPGLDLTPWRA
jgi:hypothetical protein